MRESAELLFSGRIYFCSSGISIWRVASKMPVMAPSCEMGMVDVLHEHYQKDQEEDKTHNFIKECKDLVHNF
jgi:hypothetical protein